MTVPGDTLPPSPAGAAACAAPQMQGYPYAVGQDPDEINLLEYLYALLRRKWLIVGLAFLGGAGGLVLAFVKGPGYQGTALIAPREVESQRTPNVSGLGMFGGMVASQLNIGGSANLDKIDVVLESRKFSADMIEKHDLLPLLYAQQWDSLAGGWKEDFVPPHPLAAGDNLRKMLDKEIKKNNTMSLQVTTPDSVLTHRLLATWLTHLDFYIRHTVQQEARDSRDYLEEQLLGITDHLLRTKIQELIAKEVEKMMVVSKEAFTIVDPPFVERLFREKKLYPLVFAFGMGFVAVLGVVFVHAFSGAQKSEEDQKLIAGIRHELTHV